MEPDISLDDKVDAAFRELLLNGILGFSAPRAGPPNFRPLVLRMSDPDTGAAVGGLWGETSWSFLFVELLFVPDRWRSHGFGGRLLTEAEEEAVRRGCRGAWLDTFSFQAPHFYRRRGYTDFGFVDNYPPPGQRRYFLKKTLAAG